MPFATNLAYLLYLGVRPRAEEAPLVSPPLNALEQLGEAKWLPVALSLVFAGCLGWGVFARPEFGPPAERLTLLSSLLSEERLAYALLGDVVFFAVYQSALVGADLARREPMPSADAESSVRFAARWVPFFGLAYYLLVRPPLRER
jgi:hypothetical protein